MAEAPLMKKPQLRLSSVFGTPLHFPRTVLAIRCESITLQTCEMPDKLCTRLREANPVANPNPSMVVIMLEPP